MDTKLYTTVVERSADKLYRYIVKNGIPQHEAKDIMQNCFEALWKSTIASEEQASKYLFGVAHNQCADYFRKGNRVVYRDTMPQNIPAAKSSNGQLQQHIHKALLQLSEQERGLVLLKDYEGYSYDEIASITNMSTTQVRVYLHRARTKLKTQLQQLKQVI